MKARILPTILLILTMAHLSTCQQSEQQSQQSGQTQSGAFNTANEEDQEQYMVRSQGRQVLPRYEELQEQLDDEQQLLDSDQGDEQDQTNPQSEEKQDQQQTQQVTGDVEDEEQGPQYIYSDQEADANENDQIQYVEEEEQQSIDNDSENNSENQQQEQSQSNQENDQNSQQQVQNQQQQSQQSNLQQNQESIQEENKKASANKKQNTSSSKKSNKLKNTNQKNTKKNAQQDSISDFHQNHKEIQILIDQQTKRCQEVVCNTNFYCKNGQCIPQSCQECDSNKLCDSSGKCIDRCSYVRCERGKVCKNGSCVAIQLKNCKGKTCPKGTTCKNQKCVPEVKVCPQSFGDILQTEAKVCTSRPDGDSCPIFDPSKSTLPQFCGVKQTGQKINFFNQCSPCMDKRIVFYVKKPCYKLPFICMNSEQCNGNYCVKKGCKNNQQCPYDWQVCSNNKCIDSCESKKCQNCRFGQCQFQQAQGQCKEEQKSGCKKNNWLCIQGQCTDQCVRRVCLPGHKCNKYGVCQAV